MKTFVSIAELSLHSWRVRVVSAIAIVLVLLATYWLLAAETDSNPSTVVLKVRGGLEIS